MGRLKVAILQCDDVLDKFRGRFGNYPEMVVESLREVDSHLCFEVFDVRSGAYPKAPHEFGLFVITGSKASVYDDESWIRELVQYIKGLDSQSIPVFGICFGHQIMALAMGCKVEKASKGWGVGIASTTITESGRALGFSGEVMNMIVSHQDQVVDISENAILISYSDFCPYFSVRWSESLISIQGHPEWQKEYAKVLMDDRRDRIPESVISEGLSSLNKRLDNKGFLSNIMKLFSIA